MTPEFQNALAGQVEHMLAACTRCGKCVQACPVTDAAGIAADPVLVIDGVIDLLRGGAGTASGRNWASSCVLSGDCIKACDEGVNPRFLLAMARVKVAQAASPPEHQRRNGVAAFRKVSREVSVLSRLQTEEAMLARLGQRAAAQGDPGKPAEFVFYTGCNVLKTPHIALLCLDVMDALSVTYQVMGGPSHCCGVVQLRTGDTETSGRVAQNTIEKLSGSSSGQVISWCPSCHVQFTETTLPAWERTRGVRPFEMTPFMRFLRERLDHLVPLLRESVPMRVALHRHPGVDGVMAAVEDILKAIPGLDLVDLAQPAVGLQSSSMSALPELRRDMQRRELDAAEAAGVDAVLTVYHTDHRELCAHEGDRPFQILNVLELVALSIGIHRPDHFKRLKLLQDVDAIMDDCAELIGRHRIDAGVARDTLAAMIREQPLGLRGPA